ncbi:MAG: pirin family protein [Candidatus Micrarchaeota archaeon]|nr:pirin family protein [Candidatus Micrarchaeota archaeon]
MISIVRSGERHFLDAGWLQSRYHFSFADHYDSSNMGWGALRVLNDDRIAPGGKFGMHPHANYEIFTVVLEGAIEHQDSAGHKGIIHSNGVQAMTAGKGVYHSESNPGDQPLHSLQIWITPDHKGLEPHWEQHAFKKSDFENKLCPLVSGRSRVKAPLSMRQDAVVYRCGLAAGKTIEHPASGALSAAKASPYHYLFVISGQLSLNGEKMSEGDSAKIKGEKTLSLKAITSADFLLFDLPA